MTYKLILIILVISNIVATKVTAYEIDTTVYPGLDVVVTPELAAKAAMLVSYSASGATAGGSSEDRKVYVNTPRTVVMMREIFAGDFLEDCYLITLYRGNGDPFSTEFINEDIRRWGEANEEFISRNADGEYVWHRPVSGSTDSDKIKNAMEISKGDLKDYMSCIVYTEYPDGIVGDIGGGLHPLLEYGEIAKRVAAYELRVSYDELSVEAMSIGYDFIFLTDDGERILVNAKRNMISTEQPIKVHRQEEIDAVFLNRHEERITKKGYVLPSNIKTRIEEIYELVEGIKLENGSKGYPTDFVPILEYLQEPTIDMERSLEGRSDSD